jgi:hypothetical protein
MISKLRSRNPLRDVYVLSPLHDLSVLSEYGAANAPLMIEGTGGAEGSSISDEWFVIFF